ncbi:SMEK domain-containing protein [Burkholderia cepacia]|uniref:SMEK domain-containing protein n=1 Tax=Burkholderia cepacia TaxID=292 RepID=UPI0011ABCEC7|nr:SMEK domain-containing protein [Burkholderia cepacia]MDN7894383.1 SMEK domain-containing protein [Burkholderia cepacia]
MDSIQTLTDRVAIYLAAYKYYVDIKTKAGLLDSAIFGESLARDLVKIVFGHEDLVNLNLKKSFTAIDLGSLEAACAVQVTLTTSAAKIVETQQMFFKHHLDDTYHRLMFIILRDKASSYNNQKIIREAGTFSFDPNEDVLDLGDLFNMLVVEAAPAKLDAFSKRLEAELGSVIRPYLQGVDLPGEHLQALFSRHDVRTTDAVQALKPFGMTREIFSNKMSIAELASRDLIRFVAEQFWVSEDWIDGTYDHIYSGGPGLERATDWRRSLRGAYELVKRVRSNGETLSLIIPAESSLDALDAMEDVVDQEDDSYEYFVLVARKKNDFAVDSYRSVISDTLSYRKCRDGIFLLFVAMELYEIETQKTNYIDIFKTPRALLKGCNIGDKFLVELVDHSGHCVGNHKDFVYYAGGGQLRATQDVPSRLAPFLQEYLTEFVSRRPSSFPATIAFPTAAAPRRGTGLW